MSQFQIGQRVQACDPVFKEYLKDCGYSLTGTVVDINENHRWPVKVIMDKAPDLPTVYSKDKQLVEFHISFTMFGADWGDKRVIEVIE